MAMFSPDWHAYACLQKQLRITHNDGVRSSGIEAALDRFLADVSSQRITSDTELERAAATGRRGLRRRNVLIARHYVQPDPEDPWPAQEVAETLIRLKNAVSASEWEMLTALAEGDTYADLAAKRDVTVENLRVSVFRVRRRLRLMMSH